MSMNIRTSSVRFGMIVVLIAALGLSLASRKLRTRRADYLSRATFHASEARDERRRAEEYARMRQLKHFDPKDRRFPRLERACQMSIAYHEELEAKYHQAATWPWLSMPPDPEDPGEKLSIQIDSLVEDIPWPDFARRDPPGPFSFVPAAGKRDDPNP